LIGTAAALLAGGGLLGLGLTIEERRRRAPQPPAVSPWPGIGAAGTTGVTGTLVGTGGYDPTDVTVLLPVRDEEANILPCLAALHALEGRPRVRVIDDSSSDATARLAAAAAEVGTGSATEVLAAGPLPPGWRGKVHALWVGARGVSSTWMLLADADVRVRPEAVRRALAAAACRRLDAVSFTGYQAARGLAENLLVPAVFALLDARLGDWEAAARSAGEPVANGQFLLLRRAAWESSGGFEAVRNEALDDVAIARTMRRHGFRTGFFRAPDLLTVRMYRGWGEATRGWRRNLGGLLGTDRAATLGALAILVLPVLAIAAGLAAGRGVAATLLWTAGAATSGLLRTGSGHRPVYALLYPADALFLAAVVAAGTRDWRRGWLINWKGREMKV
jgi:cellulose synthase/poly-beta-1,6-N-acetylglucosamine synthase-like glycosyltransferase